MIRVLLAEDERMVRGALYALLSIEDDIEVVAQVSSGVEILPAAHSSGAQVAVIDVDLPGLDGISAAATLHRTLPNCRTLMLTSMARPGTLHRALDAGVGGYMLKDSPPDQLAKAIREVANGSRRVVDQQLALTALAYATCPLTGRELEVLRLAAEGSDAPEIAAQMFLSVGTVRNYLTRAISKLNARNRIDAIRIVTDAGWL